MNADGCVAAILLVPRPLPRPPVPPDIVVVALMDTLLGGGSAFSSGGPGKGMYSRLFLEVLNRHGWVEGCHGWSLTFGQAGIFGIYGSCPPPYATYMFGVRLTTYA